MIYVDRYCTECEEITAQIIYCDCCDSLECEADCDIIENLAEYVSVCSICREPNEYICEEDKVDKSIAEWVRKEAFDRRYTKTKFINRILLYAVSHLDKIEEWNDDREDMSEGR